MKPSEAFPLSHVPGLNFGLGETIDMLRDSVRSFAAVEIAPRAAQIDAENGYSSGPAGMAEATAVGRGSFIELSRRRERRARSPCVAS